MIKKWLPVILAIAVLFVSHLWSRQLSQKETDNIRAFTESAAGAALQSLDLGLQSSLEGLMYVQNKGSLTQGKLSKEILKLYMSMHMTKIKSLRSLDWLDGKTDKTLDPPVDHGQQETLKTALANQKRILSGPIEWPAGRKALVFFIPITGNQEALRAIFDAQGWFETYFAPGLLSELEAEVLLEKQIVFTNTAPDPDRPWVYEKAFSLEGAEWEMRLRLSQEALRRLDSAYDQVVRFGGILLAAFLFISLTLLQTAQSRTEALEESKNLSQSRIVGLFTADSKGRIQEANEAFLKLTGYTLADFQKRNVLWKHLTLAEDLPLDTKAMEQVKTTGMCLPWEKMLVCKNGGTIPVLAGVSLNENEPGTFVHFVLDLTEGKKAEEMRLRLASIVESTDDAIIGLSPAGTIESWNRGAEKTYGYSVKEALGRPLRILLPEASQEKELAILEKAQSGAHTHAYESLRKHKDGKEITVSVSVSPIRNSTGKITGVSSVDRDVTQLKMAEDALRKKKEVEMKSQFVSLVSHELRTPMTAIKMGVDILLSGSAGAITAEQQEWLDMAERNMNRLSRLINQVLDFQKLDEGGLPFELSAASLNESVKEAGKTILPLLEGKDLQLKLELDPQLPETRFDKDRIQEVLINLLGNAVRFTEKGSITVKTFFKDGRIGAEVSDTGPGIPAEDISKLFTFFSQVNTGHRRTTGGTGLGLAISRKIIEQHGGHIGVRSEYGHGCTFFFQIPVSPAIKKS